MFLADDGSLAVKSGSRTKITQTFAPSSGGKLGNGFHGAVPGIPGTFRLSNLREREELEEKSEGNSILGVETYISPINSIGIDTANKNRS